MGDASLLLEDEPDIDDPFADRDPDDLDDLDDLDFDDDEFGIDDDEGKEDK